MVIDLRIFDSRSSCQSRSVIAPKVSYNFKKRFKMLLYLLFAAVLFCSGASAPLVLPKRAKPITNELTLQHPAADAALASAAGVLGPGSVPPSKGVLSLIREVKPSTITVFGCGDGLLAVGLAQRLASGDAEDPLLLCVDPGFSNTFVNAPPDADAGAVQHTAAEAEGGRVDPLGGASPQLHRFLLTAEAAEPSVSGILWPLARTAHLASFVVRSAELTSELLYITAAVDSRGLGAEVGADGSGATPEQRAGIVRRVADTLRRFWRYITEANGDMMESVMAGEGLPGSPVHEGAAVFANASCKRGRLHQRGSTWWLFRNECWSVV